MTTDAAMDVRARREAVVLEHMRSENEQRFDATLATFDHPRYELIPTGQVIDGVADVAAYYAASRTTFPDQRNELIALHHSDDAVIVEFWLRGTHLGGPNPTGRAFACQMAAIFSFEGDRITRERVYFDQTTITDQLRPPPE